MTLQAPQIIFLALTFLGTGICLARHGERRIGNYNFPAAIVADALIIGLLYWGGFFG